MHIQQQGVGFQECIAVSAQRVPETGWKVKGHVLCAARFLWAFRGWQALVLGSLHLCLGLFVPEQGRLSDQNVDERSGREGNPRAEAWSLVGKVKD